jgi:type II secretory pathway component PulF
MAAKAATAEKIEFLYEGTNRGGSRVKGEIFALNDALAKNELRKQGINPLKVKKKPKALFGGAQKITPADISIFARQMATMMSAGVPLVQSFEIIAQGSDNQSMQKLIMGIKNEVEGGVGLAEALSKEPLYFDPLFINLVNAGEQSGALETMLDKLATYKEKVEALKAKVKKALFYPIAVLIVAFVDLPALTRFVIDLSEFMQDWWWMIAGGIAGAVYVFFRIKKTSPKLQEDGVESPGGRGNRDQVRDRPLLAHAGNHVGGGRAAGRGDGIGGRRYRQHHLSQREPEDQGRGFPGYATADLDAQYRLVPQYGDPDGFDR